MDPKVVSLKLVLDELGVSPSIATLRDRKRVQKAIELAQASGVDLGYTFGWYIRGPYSARLTKDYFALDEALRGGDDHPESGYELRPEAIEKLAKLKSIITPPSGADLDQPEWLELLASLHYLESSRSLPRSEVDSFLREKKTHIAHHIKVGRSSLQRSGLLHT
jgi:hypothetical protein